MFRKPDSYQVGIAVVPKPLPHLYNAWFQEIYMRTREVNLDGYERSAPINFAEGLRGKLLMITGSGILHRILDPGAGKRCHRVSRISVQVQWEG